MKTAFSYFEIKKVLLTTSLLLLGMGIVQAPISNYYYVKVRITAYSSKQPREKSKTAMGKSAKNEKGVATHKSFLPFGIKIELPNGDIRIVDDRIPNKSAKKFNYNVIDVRYYESIDAKPKTRAVNRELRRKYDMGWDIIKIYRKD